jgi:hypothetical protein
VQRRQLQDRPDEPHRHGGQHAAPQRHAVSHHERRERRAQIDERGREGEEGRQDETDGIRDLEAGVLVGEQDTRSPERVQPEEPARGQERERDQQDASVAAAVRRRASGVGEHEDPRTDR